jgi:hypothetical protein
VNDKVRSVVDGVLVDGRGEGVVGDRSMLFSSDVASAFRMSMNAWHVLNWSSLIFVRELI